MPKKDAVRLGFLLIDGLSLISWAAVSEPFRAANTLSGETLYEWRMVSKGPSRRAIASNGAHIATNDVVADDPAFDMVFVCVAGDPAAFTDRATFAWLRKLARGGATLVGVSGGAYVLARAGVLAGHRCTIHWEHMPAFRERFADLEIVPALYVIDRLRMSCAGGVAGLDLALDILAIHHGPALAARVGEWFISTQGREGDSAQRGSLMERYRVSNARVLQTLAIMEANIAEPVSRVRLAALAGVSPRQLDRLFATHLDKSSGDMYREIRLAQARRLLRDGALSVTETALATGFSDASHFSRRFSQLFGVSPKAQKQFSASARK